MRIVAVCLLVAMCFGQDAKEEPKKAPPAPKDLALQQMGAARAAIGKDKIPEAIERLQKAIGALQSLIAKGLESFIPKAPKGWRRENIKSSSGNWGSGQNTMQWHQVSCRFVSDDGKMVEMTLSNSPQMIQTSRAAAKMYADPNMVAMLNKNPDTKVESVQAGEWIGFIVSNRGRRATMTVMAEKVMVGFTSSTGDFDSVKKFWNLFPRKECAAANK